RTEFKPQKIIGYLFGIFIVLSVYFTGTKILSKAENQLTAFVFTFGLIVMFLHQIILSRTKEEVRNSLPKISLTFFGMFFISWTYAHMLLIRDIRPYGAEYVYYLFVLIWIADTAAFLIGTEFGRRRLKEAVSPKKTVEGALGGVVAGVLAGVLLWKFLPLKELQITEIVILSCVIIVLGYVSDLAESLLKRSVGMKDTDVLLPGHGGILDRFDSFIFTAPILYYYLSIFHK
ncbi:MAG: phosphatidate cytidylyltransferase, partial [Elusimicrobiota bacterium]|nr:phosphatidate cytidylyltransferase [Elusimicrobiota bacterium]